MSELGIATHWCGWQNERKLIALLALLQAASLLRRRRDREDLDETGKRWLANCGPPRRWVSRFLANHPTLTARWTRRKDIKRGSINAEILTSFFDHIEELRCKHPELQDGSRWYNADETCMMPEEKNDKVIVPRGIGRFGTRLTVQFLDDLSPHCLRGWKVLPSFHYHPWY